MLTLASAPAWAEPAHDHVDHGDAVDPALEPARWTGAALGDDRSGDLRPDAAALLDAIAGADRPFSVADARARGLAPARPDGVAFAPPAAIRIWRRGLDGSTASCSGRVDVIPFDRYVKGVLPHEWIRSWNPEALKAGAVAIRTYAAAWVEAGGKYDCADLDDTTASQVYKDEFFPVTDAAVDATAGVFVARGEALVFAEYSAENGDPTEMGVAEPVCTGRARNGHGRGTCQWGTQRWALDGRTWDWMMRHYYPGATLIGGGPPYAATLGEQDHRATLTAGEEMVVWLEYTNDGTSTWTRDTAFVGTTGPRDRASPFFKAENWVSSSRPSAVDQAMVAPGAVGRFTWAMVAPEVTEPTTFTESFALVSHDGQWFGGADDAVTWTITVVPRGVDPGGVGGDEPGAETGGCAASRGGGAGGGALLVACAILLGRASSRRRWLR